jgi:predicted transcriptional regulator
MAPLTAISEDIYDRLRLIICSDQRRVLLLSLNREKKPLSDLRDEVQLDSATIIHSLRALERDNLVREDAYRNYSLTAIGKAAVHKLIDFFETTGAFVKYETFWLEHDLSGIPAPLFDRIGALRDSTLVVDTQLDPFKAYHSLVALLEKSPTVELIASVSAPDPHTLFDEFVLGHKHMEVIMTEPVLHHVIEELGQVRVEEARRAGHKLYVLRHDPKLVFAVADPVIVLLLYHLAGGFDYSAALTSESPEAIAWGHDLFRHYVDLSESVA